MLDKSKINSPCSFSEQIISYFYNEIETPEIKGFEAHLQTCPSCLDELSGFEAVRSSISEWRKIEFSGLATPVIDFLPVQTEEINIKLVSPEQNWWLAFKERFFPQSPVWAASVFAALILSIGLSIIIFNHSNQMQVAEVNKLKNSDAVSNVAEIESESNSNNFSGSNSFEKLSKELSREPSLDKIDNVSVNASAPEIFVTKIAGEANTDKKRNSPLDSKKTTSTSRKSKSPGKPGKTPLSKPGGMPFLADIEEVEDETLRLADLFDEIGGK